MLLVGLCPKRDPAAFPLFLGRSEKFLSSSWQAFLSALAKTLFGVGGIMMTPSLTLVPRCSFLYHLVFFSSFLFKVFGSVDWLPSFVLSFHHLLVTLHSIRDNFEAKLLRVTSWRTPPSPRSSCAPPTQGCSREVSSLIIVDLLTLSGSADLSIMVNLLHWGFL